MSVVDRSTVTPTGQAWACSSSLVSEPSASKWAHLGDKARGPHPQQGSFLVWATASQMADLCRIFQVRPTPSPRAWPLREARWSGSALLTFLGMD